MGVGGGGVPPPRPLILNRVKEFMPKLFLPFLLMKVFRYRSSRPEVLCKIKVFLEISQNSKENTCARVSLLIKLQISGQQLY